MNPFFGPRRGHGFSGLLLSLFLLAAPATGISPARGSDLPVIESGLLARGDHNFPPYEFNDADGNPAGFNVDIFRAVSRVMGIEARVSLGPWDQVRKELEEGRIDMLIGIFQSPLRDRFVDFSSPHLVIHHAVFVRKGARIRSEADLAGKAIIVQQQDIMHDYVVDKGFSPTIVPVESQLAGLRLLASGHHDCFLGGKLQGLATIRRFHLDNITAVGKPISPRKYGFAVKKGDAALLAHLNEGLAIVKQTGVYDSIYDKWFGLVDSREAPGPKVLRILAWVLTPALSVLAVAALWLWSLRRQVAAKTRDLEHELGERRKAEETLKRRESVLNATLESTRDGVLVIADDGTVSQHNRRFMEIWGIPGNIMSRREDSALIEYVLPRLTDPDRFLEKVREIYRSGRISRDLVHLKDGCVLERLSCPLTESGDITGRVWFFQDITERTHAEKALKESEEKYRQLVQAAPAGISEIDILSMRFLNVNDVMCEYTGYSREEFLALDPNDLLTEESRAVLEKRVSAPLAPQQRLKPMEYTVRAKNGQEFRVLINSKIFADAGGPLRAMVVAHDVTALRKAEAEKKRLETRLQEVQRLEALGTLAGGIAHDFNNLLMGIQGNASLARLDRDEGALSGDRFDNIERAVRRGMDLTNRLLGLARGGKYAVRPTDINRVVRRGMATFGRTRKEIRIEERYAEDLWPAEVDRGQIEQVLLNLCVNAWQAMPRGGTLSLATANAVFDALEAASRGIGPGKYVSVSVRDTGIGMDDATRRRIFDPFFTTKAMGQGTGLGLASAYGIVKNHGGMMDVQSAVGKGSCFVFYLPATEKAVVDEPDRDQRAPSGSGTVLLVDDEEMVRDVGGQMLEKTGFRVVTAASGADALDLFARDRKAIDAVVLDMIMPDMGGRETFQGLKAIDPGVRVLLASGYSLDGEAKAILEMGCAGFIQKPFSMDALSRKLAEVLALPATPA